MNRKLLFISYLGFIALGLNDGMLGIAWPGIRDTFGRSNDALGVLLFGFTLGYIIASSLNGWLIQKRSLAFVIMAGATGMGVGGWLLATAPLWWLLVTVSVCFGMGAAFLDAGTNTYAAANFRPRLLNWLHASFAVGTMVGTAIMTTVIDNNLEWRVGYMVAGSIYLLLVIPFALTRTEWHIDGFNDTEENASDVTALETLRQPVVLLLLLVFLLYVAVEIGLGNWAFTVLTESRGIDVAAAGWWVSIYWGSFAVGRLVLGFIETNVTRLIRLSILAIAFGVFIWWLNPAPWANTVGLLIIGFGNAPIFPALVAQTPRLVGKRHTPNAIGFQLAASGIGASLLPGIAGVFAERSTLEAVPLFFFGVSLLLIAAHEALVRWPRTR